MAAVSSQSGVNGFDMTDIEDLTNISHMLRSLLPFASPPEVAQLAFALWVLGSTTLVLALTILFHLPPAGPVFGRFAAAYYAILGVVLLVAVPVELGTALCLRVRRHSLLIAFASYLLPCAHVLLLLVVSECYSWKLCLVAVLQGNEANGYYVFGMQRNLLSLESAHI